MATKKHAVSQSSLLKSEMFKKGCLQNISAELLVRASNVHSRAAGYSVRQLDQIARYSCSDRQLSAKSGRRWRLRN